MGLRFPGSGSRGEHRAWRAAAAVLALLAWPGVPVSAQTLTTEAAGDALKIRVAGLQLPEGRAGRPIEGRTVGARRARRDGAARARARRRRRRRAGSSP